MSSSEKQKSSNVISLEEQRRNRKWIGSRKNSAKKNSSSTPSWKSKIGLWIQFIAFMAVFAYFMSKCKS